MSTIDQLHADVQSALDAALKCADSTENRTLVEVEREGLIALFLFRQAARVRPSSYEHDGHRFVVAESRQTSVGTRFGKVPFVRPVGRRVGRRTAQADLPVDRELGLCGASVLASPRPSRGFAP